MDVRSTIALYLQRADEGCRRLAATLSHPGERLVMAPRSHPRQGSVGDLSYGFHGRGVWIQFSDGVEVDLDFDDEGRWDCFDVWRLRIFAASLSGRDDLEPEELAALECQFRRLLVEGVIVRADPPELFRLA